MVDIRVMPASDLDRIAEIDRSEEISEDYVWQDRELRRKDVSWSVPPWSTEGKGEHSVRGKLVAWQPWAEEGTLLGAFDGEALVAFAIYRPRLREGLAQLAVLHVSRPYRRRGIGATLTARVVEAASRDGAGELYVSSAPTRGTVEFWMAQGFRPTTEPDPELLALEPDDIHMTMRL